MRLRDIRELLPEQKSQDAENSASDIPYTAGSIWFHGRSMSHAGDPEFSDKYPAFFTKDREIAEWYARNRRGEKDRMVVVESRIASKRPAQYGDLMRSVKATKSTRKSIEKHSPNDGHNDIDYIYVPLVFNDLKKSGFDCLVSFDAFSNEEIEILVPFYADDIDVIKVYEVND